MIKITGQKQVLSNLNREIMTIERNTAKGLLAAGLFVEGESNEHTPHDLGALVNSSFVNPPAVERGKLLVLVGYIAKYATFVHEMPESNNFSKPGTGPKFLQNTLFGNTRKILAIIKSRVKF